MGNKTKKAIFKCKLHYKNIKIFLLHLCFLFFSHFLLLFPVYFNLLPHLLSYLFVFILKREIKAFIIFPSRKKNMSGKFWIEIFRFYCQYYCLIIIFIFLIYQSQLSFSLDSFMLTFLLPVSCVLRFFVFQLGCVPDKHVAIFGSSKQVIHKNGKVVIKDNYNFF